VAANIPPVRGDGDLVGAVTDHGESRDLQRADRLIDKNRLGLGFRNE